MTPEYFDIILFITTMFYNIECSVDPIYCQIIENRPNIDKVYARDISHYINKYSEKYDIPADIYAAILMQESSYRLSAKGCHRRSSQGYKICDDFGISQINRKTAKAFDFDTDRLLVDLKYSIRAGAYILYDFKERYAHREEYWWTRYNTSNPDKRLVYKESVERYIISY